MGKNFIPDRLYREIQKKVPIVCVDAVIKTEEGVLLGVRKSRTDLTKGLKDNPAKGLPWIIGGRVLYHERLNDAVKRKVKEETGLNVRIIKQIGVYTVFTNVQKRHNIAIDYLVEKTGGTLKLSDEYSKFLFIKKPDKKLHPYVSAVLRDSGVFGKFIRRTNKANEYSVD